jgi:hypothetical protein
MKRVFCCWMATFLTAMAVLPATADEAPKYTLRYKFQPGETIRWQVEHRSHVRTTVSGATQTVETVSISAKAWQCKDVRPDGTVTFEHRVEWVDMRQRLSGREEVRYNSRTDAQPPASFRDVAKSIGVPLSTVTMDAKGKVLRHERRGAPSSPQSESWMTTPLPDEAVPVGHRWTLPLEISLPLETGGVKQIKAVQQFVLESVKTGVATISVSTDVLTPVTDPRIESQLVERETSGRVRFDIDAGRVLDQQLDVDRHVVGFRGEASSIHYVNRFTEQLLPESAKTARK